MAPARFPLVFALGVADLLKPLTSLARGRPGLSRLQPGRGVEPRGHKATSGSLGGLQGRPPRHGFTDHAYLWSGLLPPRSLGPRTSVPSERGHGRQGIHLMEKLPALPQAAVTPFSGASVFQNALQLTEPRQTQ